jgi:hypothetical protein
MNGVFDATNGRAVFHLIRISLFTTTHEFGGRLPQPPGVAG